MLVVVNGGLKRDAKERKKKRVREKVVEKRWQKEETKGDRV